MLALWAHKLCVKIIPRTSRDILHRSLKIGILPTFIYYPANTDRIEVLTLCLQ